MKLPEGCSVLETMVRFTLGGLAVAGCYVISLLVPVKLVAGLFAAFPAIMISSVFLSGYREGSDFAGEVAKGAIAGMVGCTFCVISVIIFLKFAQGWPLAVLISVPTWFLAAFLINKFFSLRHQVKEEQ